MLPAADAHTCRQHYKGVQLSVGSRNKRTLNLEFYFSFSTLRTQYLATTHPTQTVNRTAYDFMRFVIVRAAIMKIPAFCNYAASMSG
jgi:hypothetical protein